MKKYFVAALIISATTFAMSIDNMTFFGGVNANGKQTVDKSATFNMSGLGQTTSDADKMGYTIGLEAHGPIAKFSKAKLEGGFGAKYESSFVGKDGKTTVAYVPVYGSLKASVTPSKKLSIYVQGTLGYNYAFEGDVYKTLNEDFKKYGPKISGGLYTGIGAGVDYGKYNAGVTYSTSNSEYVIKDSVDNITYKIEDSRVSLTLGYKIGK